MENAIQGVNIENGVSATSTKTSTANNTVRKPHGTIWRFMEKLAASGWWTALGVAIVVGLTYLSGYLFNNLASYDPIAGMKAWPSWAVLVPFGAISCLSSVMSLLSTRWTSSMRNAGNIIGVVQAVIAGLIDWVLGNSAAWLTYPVSFAIELAAVMVWTRSDKYKARKAPTGIKATLMTAGILVGSFAFSFGTNWYGYGMTVPTGAKGLLFWLVVVSFAFSIAGNLLNAAKLTQQWPYWAIYNGVQLIKATIQGNFANVGKYIYYILNSIAALVFWKGKDAEPNK